MPPRGLEIGEHMTLPLKWMTMASVVYGARGSGKSTLGRVLAEEIANHAQRFCAIDPTGAWWGLKSSESGTDEGLPVVIFGGDHADLPLEPTAGATIADLVVELPQSIIIDLERFSKGKQITFLGAFFDRLYDKNRDPLLLLMDEAQRYAPQRPMSTEASITLGTVEDIVKLGRKHGIGPVVFTQRGSGLNKEVSELADVLIAFRTPGVLDQGRVKDWLEGNVTKSQMDVVMNQLSGLETGVAVFASAHPDLSFFRTIRVRRPRTFDSSATPEVGKARKEPRRLAQPDIEALEVRMADAIERAKADDPKALRARISQLEREAKARPPETIETIKEVPVERVVEVPILDGATYEAIVRLDETLRRLTLTASKAEDAIRERPAVTPARVSPAVSTPRQQTVSTPRPTTTSTSVLPTNGAIELPKTARAVLSVLAQFETRSQRQVAILSGYSPTSGGFFGALAFLRKEGMIEGPKGTLSITDLGRAAVGPIDPLPAGRDLLNYWLGKLSKTEAAVLRYLVENGATHQDEVAAGSGYSPTSGGFFGALAKLRSLELIEGPKAALSATPEIMEAFRA